MKNSLEIISDQIMELACRLISSELNDNYMKLIERYNSYFSQFIQIVSAMPEAERKDNSFIRKVGEKHKELEKKFEKDKTGIREAIMKLNSDLSIKQKYYGKNITRMGVNRKG
ncbi:hypothetical protein EP073_07505 [Geovibrio thiophilus]|uniref:Flagellar protein FliT n=1 Tax=Geovibrio thiophilus TaxID=139438 RepID=A0A410JYL8_9BACT|nr:hypothetical protein [Geovibrio thiophilus]QAR33252.1 hypothetical protein EP073_07505 [Geovibrio thiophilus]